MGKKKAAAFNGIDPELYPTFMAAALQQAHFSAKANEVPVGAVVVRNGAIIGRGRDCRFLLNDPTAHAEILAIREASQYLDDWRLDDCALFVTVEPCAMCAGAILLARLPLVVFGTRNRKFGACGSICNVCDNDKWNHRVTFVEGVKAQECADLMRDWFQKRRRPRDDSQLTT